MNGEVLKLDNEGASYVLAMLLENREIRPAQIEKVMRQKDAELVELRARVAMLEGIGGRLNGPKAKTTKAKSASPKLARLRRLQGQYMGYMRYLSDAEKDRVRKVKDRRGMVAAVGIASRLSANR
jgi:hypothetical protein